MANNIIRRVWNQNRMVNIEDLTGAAFQAEIGGHTFEISGIDDTGAAVTLSGTVSGVFRRPDNADIALTGSASDGVVSVTLSEDCYAVPGRFGLTIFVTSDSQKVAVYACVGTVAVSSTGNVAGDTPASVEDLIDDINAAIADLNTAIGSIPADYSQFMAAIAPAYSSSALYSVGSYAWYDGDLYRCTTPITTAEAWTAGHWAAVALANDVADLNSAFTIQSYDVSMMKQSMPDDLFDEVTATYNPHFEQGAISNETGKDTSSSTRIRTGFIKVGDEVVATNSGSNECWIRAYSAANQDSFIGNYVANSSGNLKAGTASTAYGFSVDSIALVNPSVKYIRVVEKKSSGNILPSESTFTYTYKEKVLNGDSLSNVFYSKVKSEGSVNDIPLMYDIDEDGHYTKGYLKLPSNYVRTGAPVPLIVFVHGSADFGGISSPAMTTHYNDYYNYLRDCGYAIFDCYGFGSAHADSAHSNTWGIPLNDKCYLSGIHYVCEKYNIDKNNIFVCCKSLGGLQAFNMLLNPAYDVKAVAMLAPELWELGMKFGYNAADRQIVAADLGFSEDTGNVLDFGQGDPIPEGFWDYVTANMDKWNGIFPNFRGLPILPANKPDYYTNASGTGTMSRVSLSRPVKIWIAQDDDTVSYNTASAVISSLKNAGCNATLRTMPNNTGGHHSVDTDANAPQTKNVTTRLGVTYETIPTAYYEVGKFFDEFMSK